MSSPDSRKRQEHLVRLFRALERSRQFHAQSRVDLAGLENSRIVPKDLVARLKNDLVFAIAQRLVDLIDLAEEANEEEGTITYSLSCWVMRPDDHAALMEATGHLVLMEDGK